MFDHWVFMFGHQPRRTRLDDKRRQVINAALALYDWDVELMLHAVEGAAAWPMGGKPESMRDAMQEIAWFMSCAQRIEQCLRLADEMHARAEAAAADAVRQASAAEDVQVADPAAAAAARERLRDIARQCRGQHG